MDEALARRFEAHVAFELARWAPDAVPDTAGEEVDAAFDVLGPVPLRALVPPERARGWLRRAVAEVPLTDELLDDVVQAVVGVHELLQSAGGTLDEVLPQEHYDQFVAGAVGLRRLRHEVIEQVTQSRVYADLVSHVLYHGVKGYLLTENAVVRRIPGASSLVRMGQNAVRSATPQLEAGIDRRLLAFVAANVADTVRDSRAFLETVLDDDALAAVAAEVWATNGPRDLGGAVGLVEAESLDALVTAGWDTWLTLRTSPLVAAVVDAVVDGFYETHGDEPVEAVLAAVGLDRAAVGEAVTAVAGQLAEVARTDGRLETYVRRRLSAFYETLP